MKFEDLDRYLGSPGYKLDPRKLRPGQNYLIPIPGTSKSSVGSCSESSGRPEGSGDVSTRDCVFTGKNLFVEGWRPLVSSSLSSEF